MPDPTLRLILQLLDRGTLSIRREIRDRECTTFVKLERPGRPHIEIGRMDCIGAPERDDYGPARLADLIERLSDEAERR